MQQLPFLQKWSQLSSFISFSSLLTKGGSEILGAEFSISFFSFLFSDCSEEGRSCGLLMVKPTVRPSVRFWPLKAVDRRWSQILVHSLTLGSLSLAAPLSPRPRLCLPLIPAIQFSPRYDLFIEKRPYTEEHLMISLFSSFSFLFWPFLAFAFTRVPLL